MGISVDKAVTEVDSGVPSCAHFIDPTLPQVQMEAKVRNVCRALLDKWSHLDDDQLIVSPVTGGITNSLLKVQVCGDREEEPVTIRVFGINTDAVIDRKREFQAIPSLSSAGFGAKLLGVFKNGMIQTFIDARTLTPSDIRRPEIAARIAREIRRLHELDVPGSKEPQLWPDIHKFLDQASILTFEDKTQQSTYETISFNELRDEVDAVQEASMTLDAPVVFAHNDLLSGNFMLDEQNETLYIIDFEYATYNYRGYDIANHFAEYAGFECDYSLYPSKDAQFHFFRHYLCPSNPQKVSLSELERLYVETSVYALASHLFWAVWAVLQAKYSSIDFNYFEYFFQRYGEYKKRKHSFLSLLEFFQARNGDMK